VYEKILFYLFIVLLVLKRKYKEVRRMSVLEQVLLDWQKDQTNQFFALLETRLEEIQTQQDIVKQKYCAAHFDVSVNTLKEWVLQGCPEIRLDSGMVLYSIQAVRRWLLTYQN